MPNQQTLQPLVALATVVIGPNLSGQLSVDIRMKKGLPEDLQARFDRASAAFLEEFARDLTPEQQLTTGDLSPELTRVRNNLAKDVS